MTRNELFDVACEFYTYGGVSEREIAFARAVMAKEREACAKVCLEEAPSIDGQLCADAIRARGNNDN